ncbi:MAG: hypothetical protein Q9207_006510 [Kuettlingeria erythrocarpa]
MRTATIAGLTCLALNALTVVHCLSLAPPPIGINNPLPTTNPSASDFAAIHQTLSLFAVSIDLKKFDLLSTVFHPDATANFTGDSLLVGIPAIKSYLAKGLAGLKSQHHLGTLYINQTGPNTAMSYNWLQGTFFGGGAGGNAGGGGEQVFSNFGYYEDGLVKEGGRWYIKSKVTGGFGQYGNESLVATLLNG